MPRLPPSLIHQAARISPNLATLLPACRDLLTAKNELRWIRGHALSITQSRRVPSTIAIEVQNVLTTQFCARRGRGVPLQYVLGTQPFGNLDIKCRPGVLIPRPETEAYVVYLADLLIRNECSARKSSLPLRIVDFCSGTGCIGLLLYALLRPHFSLVTVKGFDVSDAAVALARENLRYNVRKGLLPTTAEQQVVFEKADIFSYDSWAAHVHPDQYVDLLISNPPYVSARGFNSSTSRSVRNHEPKLALMPDVRLREKAENLGCVLEDVFYAQLLSVAQTMRPRWVLFEVGDMEQALRVADRANVYGCNEKERAVQIWRDWPDISYETTEAGLDHGTGAEVKGSGNGRSVFIY